MKLFLTFLLVIALSAIGNTLQVINTAVSSLPFVTVSFDAANLLNGMPQGRSNLSLTLHLMFGLWAAWRTKFALQGIGIGIAALYVDDPYLVIYLLYLSVTSGGDFKTVLLGDRNDKKNDKE